MIFFDFASLAMNLDKIAILQGYVMVGDQLCGCVLLLVEPRKR
jgi:hypothetical protein